MNFYQKSILINAKSTFLHYRFLSIDIGNQYLAQIDINFFNIISILKSLVISAMWLALRSVICLRITLFFALNHICSKSCCFCFKSHHFRSISHHFCFKHKMRCKSLFVSTFLSTNQLLDQQNIGTVEPLSTDTSLIRTPLYYRQFAMSRQNSHIFSVKKKTIIQILCNMDNGH